MNNEIESLINSIFKHGGVVQSSRYVKSNGLRVVVSSLGITGHISFNQYVNFWKSDWDDWCEPENEIVINPELIITRLNLLRSASVEYKDWLITAGNVVNASPQYTGYGISKCRENDAILCMNRLNPDCDCFLNRIN